MKPKKKNRPRRYIFSHIMNIMNRDITMKKNKLNGTWFIAYLYLFVIRVYF